MAVASKSLRRKLVAELEKGGSIKSPPVRRAFLAVPRELFVEDHARRGGLTAVYKDAALVTKTDAKGGAISSSSQPAIMAIMLEALRLRSGHRVLEVGAGTGYNASLLAHMVGPAGAVTAIDIDPELVARAKRALRRNGTRATIVAGDGRAGYRTRAPYDRIIVTASTDFIPRAWWSQLEPNGLLEVPFRLLESGDGTQSVVVFERTETGFRSIDANPGGFMGLRGGAAEEAPLVRAARMVGAYEGKGNSSHMYGYLSGGVLARAGREGRRHLTRILLDEPRSRALGTAAQANALQTFLTLGLPRASLVQYVGDRRWGVGVVSPDFGGVAVAVRRMNGKTEIKSFGARAAERILNRALAEWEAVGSPRDRDLEISVSFDGKPKAWRVMKRQGCHIGVDWRKRPTK